MAKFFLLLALALGFTGTASTAFAGGNVNTTSTSRLSVSDMEKAAKTAIINKEYEKAANLMIAIYQQDPQNMFAIQGMTVFLNEGGYHDKALEMAKKGLEVDPKNAELWCEAGIAQWKLGNHESARTLLIKSIDLKSSYKLPYNVLITMLNQAGDTDKAEKIRIIRDQYCK